MTAIKSITHQNKELKWLKPEEIQSPKTLVLGSFNPFRSELNSVDYYYGRSTNYFWKVIARIIQQNESYFFDTSDGLNRKKSIMDNRFCCFDIIDKIDFESDNESVLFEYIEKKILKKFTDSTIWTSKTRFKNEKINLYRHYNEEIITFLNTNKSIDKIIHTMGSRRIVSVNQVFPKRDNGSQIGFSEFFNSIMDVCKEKNINFIFKSLSPSQIAVNKGITNRQELETWLGKYLNLL